MDALRRIEAALNGTPDVWRAFLDDPLAVLAPLEPGASASAALVRTVDRIQQPTPYVPGWPISRLEPGVAYDTYSILMSQYEMLEDGRDGTPSDASEPGASFAAGRADARPADEGFARFDFDLDLGHGDALLIVPPVADLNRPSLAAHLLQSCAREVGLEVRVLYANVLLAAGIGKSNYQSLAYAPQAALLGEGVFSSVAYGLPSLIDRGGWAVRSALEQTSSKMKLALTPERFRVFEDYIREWVGAVAAEIVRHGFPVVGATTTFEQTSASVALLNAVKALDADTCAILGGANCEGEMAEGILSLGSAVDVVFSGESEETFVEFLRGIRAGRRPAERILRGRLGRSLNDLPAPRYTEYYAQRERFLPFEDDELANTWLPYEASRGCWWGEKNHCTFCGLNGMTMQMRQKSPERVLGDLAQLLDEHPSGSVWMTDNIMPRSYFDDLLPQMREELPGIHVYWDQKSNLSLDQVEALRSSGVGIIQPGIEALSTSLLRRMDKGVSARQNLATLRYTRSVGLPETWNILFAFPGDEAADYDEQVALLGLLHHLQPPTWLARVNIDRFSPYHSVPERYGIEGLAPHPAYVYTFPPHAEVDKLAYHFSGHYRTAANDTPEQTLAPLARAFDAWRAEWRREGDRPPPSLCVVPVRDDLYLLLDTRGLAGTQRCTFVTPSQASVALVGRSARALPDPTVDWALERKAGVMLDGRYVPLATADYHVLREFEEAAARAPRPVRRPPARVPAANVG